MKVGGREGRCEVERTCWTGAEREWWPARDRRLAHPLCLHTAGGEGGKERPASGGFQKPFYLAPFPGLGRGVSAGVISSWNAGLDALRGHLVNEAKSGLDCLMVEAQGEPGAR